MTLPDLFPTTYLEEEWVNAVDLHATDHNLPLAIDIDGPFDRGALRDTLRAMASRQETLRMAFSPQEQGMRRAVWPEVEPLLEVADFTAVDPGEQDKQLETMILSEARQPVNLTVPPVWRALLIRLAAELHVLVTIWHHAVFDGWSTRVVFSELTALYGGALLRQQPRLPEPEVQMADYAGWERQLRLPGDALEYWRGALPGDRAALPMETGYADLPQVMAGRRCPTVSAADVRRLDGIARGVGVTLTSALRGVVLTALRPYLPRRLVIGCVHGNRERPELQRVVGLLSDHLPVRIDLADRMSFLDLISAMHDAVRTARRYQAPSGTIASAVGSIPAGEQMFEVSVNNMRQSAPLAEQLTTPDGATVRFTMRELPGTELWPHIRRPFSGGVRLGYQLRQTLTGELSGELWGHVPAFRTATIDALGRDFAETASRVVSDPRQDIAAYAPPAGAPHP